MPCILCHGPENVDDMKVYSSCDISDGLPCLPCKEYIDLESKIMEAKKTLESMVLQQKEIRTRINQHHDPITSTFPSEIVSAIFHNTFPKQVQHSIDSLLRRYKILRDMEREDYRKRLESGPLVLGSVCQSWRRIAWSSPQLWTSIPILVEHAEKLCQHDIIERWLSRSGQLPLSVHMGHNWNWETTYNWGTVTPNRVISIVRQHSDRWRELHLDGSASFIQQSLDGLENTPHLRTLTIKSYSSPSNGTQTRTINASILTPEHVTLNCPFSFFDIGWSHVTYVYLEEVPAKACIQLLQHAIKLVNCVICYLTTDDPSISPYIPHTHFVRHALQSLEIEYDGEFSVVFNSFILPNLSCLKVGGHMNVNAIIDCLERSCCALTSLGFDFPLDFEYGSLIEMLHKNPSIRTLEVLNSSALHPAASEYRFLILLGDTLNPQAQESPESLVSDRLTPEQVFLPNLQTINLAVGTPTQEFWRHVVGIFGRIQEVLNPRSRRRPLNRLQVRWDFRDQSLLPDESYIDNEAIVQFIELKKAGVTLDLRSHTLEYDFLKLSMDRHGITYDDV